jgi:hypothetical protein
VVQVACPVSHFAAAGYFRGKIHYSVLRPIRSPTASPRSTDFPSKSFNETKRKSCSFADHAKWYKSPSGNRIGAQRPAGMYFRQSATSVVSAVSDYFGLTRNTNFPAFICSLSPERQNIETCGLQRYSKCGAARKTWTEKSASTILRGQRGFLAPR